MYEYGTFMRHLSNISLQVFNKFTQVIVLCGVITILYFSVVENRGGHRGAARGSGGRQQSSALRFDGEFDFETSNAQFDKVQIEKELKEKLTLGILLSTSL